MKRNTWGIICLVIGGLNILGWIFKSRVDGSPLYIVLMVLMFFAGLALIGSKGKTSKDIKGPHD